MPRHAEAMPMPEPQEEQEMEDLSDEAKLIEPPPIPKPKESEEATNDTKEALEDLRQISIQRDMEAAAEERRKIMETRDAAATERMKRNMGASVLQELPPEDVHMEGDWTPPAGAVQDKREYMPASPPPIPKDAKKPSLLKRIGKWFRG